MVASPRETFAGGDPSARQTHLARLLHTAAAFGVHVDEHRLRAAIDDVDARGALLRIRASDDGSIAVLTDPLRSVEAPVNLCISDVRVRSDDPMLAWKTSWRPAYERAAEYAGQRSCFDALVVNERGQLTEGSRTNLFVRLGDDLVTPPLCDGVFPGILRARLLAEGTASERSLLHDDLRRAREIFIGNSARGMVPAVLIEQPTP